MAAVAPRRNNLLDAPADRAAGERGPRGPLAGAVAVGALPVLALSSVADGSTWIGVALAVAAAVLTAAAVLLWTARRPASLALAAALIPVAVAGAVFAYAEEQEEQHEADRWGGSVFRYEQRGRVVTEDQAKAVPVGATKADLTARLGVPAGSGVQRLFGEPDMRCLAYRRTKRAGMGKLHAFCFRDGRYAALRRW